MLTNMREGIKKSRVLKYFLVIFICAPFAFFGINSYFGNGGSVYAVKINGDEVSARVYEQELNVQRNRLRQAFGGKIPDGFSSDSLLRQQALESVITSQVISQLLQEQEIVVSNKTLANAITKTEAFQKDGAFDNDRYEAQLRSSGYSVESFESQFRQDVAQSSLRDAIVQSNFVLPTEKQYAKSLFDQSREFESITFKLVSLIEKTEISDDEISKYFDERKDEFMYPERVQIEYIEITPSSLSDGIEVTDEEAQAHFDSNKSNYVVNEERSASHILFSLEEGAEEDVVTSTLKKAEDVKSRLDSGELFEDLAKEYSQDPGSAENGGSLGFFARGAMVPAFEESVFSLKQGVVSEPVKSTFGYHIIRVDGIKEEHGKEFSEVKDEIVTFLKENKSNDIFYDKNEILSNQTYENPDSLIPAAEAGDFEIQESDWIDSTTISGIGKNPQILAAALSDEVLKDGSNSPLIELGENNAVVLRLKEHEDPRAKELEDVKQEIKDLLKRREATKNLDELVTTALDKLETGQGTRKVAEELQGDFFASRDVTRSESSIDQSTLTALFKIPKPTVSKPEHSSVKTESGDRVVLSLLSVTAHEDENETSETDQNQLDPARAGSAEFQALLNHLRSKAIIELNEQILQPAIQ